MYSWWQFFVNLITFPFSLSYLYLYYLPELIMYSFFLNLKYIFNLYFLFLLKLNICNVMQSIFTNLTIKLCMLKFVNFCPLFYMFSKSIFSKIK